MDSIFRGTDGMSSESLHENRYGDQDASRTPPGCHDITGLFLRKAFAQPGLSL